MDIPASSFLIESEAAGKKVLYDLGFMKAWKEKLPPLSEFSTRHFIIIIIIPRGLFLDSEVAE